MKLAPLFVVAAAVAFVTLAVDATRAQQEVLTGVHRTLIQQHDLSVPGYEVVQNRVDIEPGMIAPKHKHPGEEVIYVIEGTLEYDLQGRAPVVLRAGEGITVPAGVPHSAKNIGTGNGAELGTYFVPKGKPLAGLVK